MDDAVTSHSAPSREEIRNPLALPLGVAVMVAFLCAVALLILAARWSEETRMAKAPALEARARLFRMQGKWDLAAKELTALVELLEDQGTEHLALGEASLRLARVQEAGQKVEEARRSYRAALRALDRVAHSPEAAGLSEEAEMELGELLCRDATSVDEALVRLEKVVKRREQRLPGDAFDLQRSRLALARALVATGDLTRGLSLSAESMRGLMKSHSGSTLEIARSEIEHARLLMQAKHFRSAGVRIVDALRRLSRFEDKESFVTGSERDRVASEARRLFRQCRLRFELPNLGQSVSRLHRLLRALDVDRLLEVDPPREARGPLGLEAAEIPVAFRMQEGYRKDDLMRLVDLIGELGTLRVAELDLGRQDVIRENAATWRPIGTSMVIHYRPEWFFEARDRTIRWNSTCLDNAMVEIAAKHGLVLDLSRQRITFASSVFDLKCTPGALDLLEAALLADSRVVRFQRGDAISPDPQRVIWSLRPDERRTYANCRVFYEHP